MEPSREPSPRFTARMGGVFYLVMTLCGTVASVARRGIIVSGDAAATAANIVAHQSMYVLAYAGDLLFVVSYLAVTALFYRMLKPVSRTVSLTAALCSLTGCAIQAAALTCQLAPLTLLGGAPYLGVFKAEQLQALAYASLKLYSQGYCVALVFFAFYCLLTGYLAFKSTFLPRVLSGLLMFAGLSWLTFLSPPFATTYFSYILPCGAGEALFALWLLVKGVDAEKWKQRAAAARLAEPIEQRLVAPARLGT
jgi:uncharacterized protein DUF4386